MTIKRDGPKVGFRVRGVLKPVVFSLALIVLLAGCVQAPAAAPQEAPATKAAAPASVEATATAVLPPSPVPTLAPTATSQPTPTLAPSATLAKPTATATSVPPQALSVLSDKFNIWCAPLEYAGTRPTSASAPADARQLEVKDKQLVVATPATYCVVVVTYNQPAPAGAQLYFFDANSPFLKLALQPVEGHAEQAWAAVSHNYVVNPPFWHVNYRLAVVDANNKELWSDMVMFAKRTPKDCPFGGLPDPVTLFCAVSDPWEIEPHPDATYPYDHDHLPTPAD